MPVIPNGGKGGAVYRIAVPAWEPEDDIALMIEHELRSLNHQPIYFNYEEPVPEDIDILLSYGPYDKILPIWQAAARRDNTRRPLVIHWNTEGIPDLRIPARIMKATGAFRSKIGRLSHAQSPIDRKISKFPLITWFDRYFYRYRYFGDYEYAYRKGWLHLLFDSSNIYCRLRSKVGIPTQYAPWGASSVWYEDMGLERDIDVIWMGKRGTRRRKQILDRVCRELMSKGVKVYIADNELNPFIFGRERTTYLNRAKITINITRTWYDDNFSRFIMAAPNRSLVVSEPVLPHCLEFKENIHYVSAKIKDLPETICYYLDHDRERQQIIENAYQLAINELQFSEILKRMLDAAAFYLSPVRTEKFHFLTQSPRLD